MTDDARLHSPAADRNAAPILAVLQRVLPPQGTLLEIASGTGQHAAAFAAALPRWRWLPTDADPRALASIAAWCAGLANVDAPRLLDVAAEPWNGVPVGLDAIYCANLIHIAPWACTAALMQGAAHCLAPGGQLVTYGPYLEDGAPTAPSNQAFDTDLRARNPAWGIRRLDDVAAEAEAAGLALHGRHALPANNLVLVFWGRAVAKKES